MSFLLQSDLNEFLPALRQLLAERIPAESLRKVAAQPYEADGPVWTELAALGVFAAALSEDHGGLGFGVRGLAAILQEQARVLSPLPIFETLGIAYPLLCSCESGALRDELLSGIAAGMIRATAPVGVLEDVAAIPRAVGEQVPGSACRLNGGLSLVPSLERSSDVFVTALAERGTLVLCRLRTADLSPQPTETIDLVRRFSECVLIDTPAVVIGRVENGARASLVTQVASSAELVGCGRTVLEMTTEYVKTRKQFGASIGTFQAIQHKLADALVSIESAESLVRVAAWTADASESQFHEAVAAAKGFCSESIPSAIEACLQAHGGIGFTYEYDLHLYLRRAQMLSSLFGLAEESYRILAQSALGR
ncbi:MAG: acyl-CoA/acyl-ACP dehydrogenase [Deltaproteobacteria bacterium]|nr:acyl-CoA/acyl-ACP dehydrogenase [Deltaproteobacteria bacterium]